MNVLDFIDSSTLRKMLENREIPPAIECILIAQSKKCTVTEKAEAIRERLDKYTDEEFEEGIYSCPFDDFREGAERYIEHIEKAEKLLNEFEKNIIYVIRCDDVCYDGAAFDSYEKALKLVRLAFGDECRIVRRKINSLDPDMTYYLNKKKKIYDVRSQELEEDESLAFSCAELNDDYKTGDIIRYGDEKYAVVAKNTPFKSMDSIDGCDYTDMSLYCIEYSAYPEHSCGGSFPHVHIPILEAELVDIDELPSELKPLKELSRVLKGEVNTVEFIQAYSNNYLDEIVF